MTTVRKTQLQKIRRHTAKECELCTIYDNMDIFRTTEFQWDLAILSQYDRIIPFQNQKNYWHGKSKTIEKPWPHFPFNQFNNWQTVIDLIKDDD